MTIDVLMPALSPTMTEGNLAKWHKKEGDEVSAGDVIAEIETDKATMEVEAVDEGVLGRILVPEGTEDIAVNTVIALLLEEGEDTSDLDAAEKRAKSRGDSESAETPETEEAPKAPAQQSAAKPKAATEESREVKATPLARRMAEQAGIDLSALSATAPGGKVGKADVEGAMGGAGVPPTASGDGGNGAQQSLPPAGPAPRTSEGERIFASPLARSMARQAGIDLIALAGSGPGGRIVKADIEAAVARGTGERPAPAEAPGAAAAGPPTTERPHEDIKPSNVRKVIARRMTESARDIPHIYLTVDCEIDRLLAARKEINEAAPEGDDTYKVSVNDMIIKAAAVALRRFPRVNVSWVEETIRQWQSVDISVAVAYEEGLITPIIFDADRKGVARISNEMKDLAGRARTGKLKPEEYQGGTFSISNLGMLGVREFTAVINPPQACILAVGAGEERVVVRDGEMRTATVMTCTLSCDHRVVDGALGARWLQVFKKLIEAPATMLA